MHGVAWPCRECMEALAVRDFAWIAADEADPLIDTMRPAGLGQLQRLGPRNLAVPDSERAGQLAHSEGDGPVLSRRLRRAPTDGRQAA